MRQGTKVLSIGSEEWSDTVRNSMPEGQKEGFLNVESYRNLCALPECVSVDIAVFHHTFAKNHLREAAEYVRRRWPLARILLVGWKAGILDDPLYDDWKKDGISAESLMRLITTSAMLKGRIGGNGIQRSIRP